MRATWLAVTIAGCSGSTGTGTLDTGPTGTPGPSTGTTASWPDLEASCAAVWPAPNCLGGCADPEAQLWADGYLDHLAAEWALPRSTVDDHVRVRHVNVWGTPTRHAELDVQLEFDWVISVFDVRAELPGVATSAADTAAAFTGQVPQVDVTAAPRPWADIETFIADCELQLGVTFPDPGCQSYVTMQPDDDDQAGVRFDYQVGLSATEYAYAAVYAWGSEPDRCDTNQYGTY